MDEREELKQELVQELEWIHYRMRMLDLIEEKLFQMKHIAEQIENHKLTKEERQMLKIKINDLSLQVEALDSESKKIEQNEILDRSINEF